MANNIIKRVWNQNTLVNIEALRGAFFQDEDGGHTFEISGVDNSGNAISLSGTVAGVFLRPDNTDVPITGSASGGIVSVTLPAECYDVPGRFGLTVFVTSDGQKTCVYAAIGTVGRTSSGSVAPGTSADVVDLINQISAAVATIPASWSGLMADIAPTYSTSAAYPVGAYVYYNGDLYRCTTAITTGETWTAAHWTTAVLGNDVSDLKTALNQIQPNAEADLKNEKLWSYGTISSTGVISDNHDRSNIITIGLIGFNLQYSFQRETISMMLIKYKNGVFVSRSEITEQVGKIEMDSTFDSFRLMLLTNTANTSYTVAQMLGFTNYMLSARMYELNNRISLIQNGVVPEYISGVIATNGTWTGGNNDNFCTSIIRPSLFQTIDVSCDNGYMFSIAKYNGDTFSERIGWYYHSSGVIELDNSYGYRINIAKETASGSTLEQMLEHFSIVINGNDMPTLRREIESSDANLNFLNRISCCYTGNKICHYSVDDTYALLKDLTDNANTYTSIFENPTLAAMLSIHNDTGMCITFNTFNTSTDDVSYSIANVPQKAAFQAEFQANKNWLKFAFHAESTPTNYDTATGISAAYDTFVIAIYKLTGDYDCIDRITRLGYFGGTLENVLTIKNKDHGIIGLLCADTTNRASYYLSDEQNDLVQQKGMCIDTENELIFLKTITRNLGTTAQNEINGNLCYQKYVELFSHEYETSWITNCGVMCQWAKENGYVFAFPSLIFDLKDAF